jgi:hypothetical protein
VVYVPVRRRPLLEGQRKLPASRTHGPSSPPGIREVREVEGEEDKDIEKEMKEDEESVLVRKCSRQIGRNILEEMEGGCYGR